jgi:hypothetical protein
MLSKQSIRGNVQIKLNGQQATKDQIIDLSVNWSENEEKMFRKILKQGGKFKIQNQSFEITTTDRLINSRGNADSPIIPLDHTGDEVDLKYLR